MDCQGIDRELGVKKEGQIRGRREEKNRWRDGGREGGREKDLGEIIKDRGF